MQRLVEQFDDPAYVVSFDGGLGRVMSWNRAVERALGYAAEEAIGHGIDEVLRGMIDARSRLRRIVEMRSRGSWQGRTVLQDRRGRPTPFQGGCIRLVGGTDYLTVLRLPLSGSGTAPIPGFFAGIPRAGNMQAGSAVVDSHVVFAATGIKQTIGNNIRRAREQTGLPQRQLALRLDISPSRLNDYEHGRIKPHDDRIAAIAAITGAPSIGWFYDQHEEQGD